ncbi:MAG: CHASE2 domain-containing protein, partial [Phycisphaerales bacterium]
VTNGDYPYDLRSTADKPAHEALLERIRKEMPAIPRLRSIERGRQLEVLLERCLAWERGQRLGSVAQLEADIGRYLQNQRIKTKPLSMSHRLRRLAVGFATKARWAALAAVIALVMTVLICATFWFDVRWRAAGYDYAGDASTASIPAGDGRDSMVVVGISDDTVEAIGAFARESGFSGVTTDVRTFRAVHGYLMERLASAAPKAVVWDYYFRTPRPGDSSFVAGVDALESARIPVLLASQTYDDYGNPDLSHNITDVLGGRIRHGAIVARHMVEREGEFVMAIRRSGGACIPSLALATLAAVLHPNTRLEIGWSHDDRDFDLLYETAPGAFLREHDRLGLTKVFHSKLSASAVREGDLLGCKTFEFQKPEQWEAQTVTYEYLLTCDDDELRTKVMNKILLVGDLRKPRLGFHADRHSVRYGSTVVQDVPGCYLLADAIAGLLNRRYMKAAFPPAPAVILLILLLAVVGGLVPMGVASSSVLENPRNRRILWMSLLGLAAWCFVMMVLSEGYASVHLGMAGFSLLLVTCGSFWVEFTRNQHRMLERERGAVDNLAIGSERTLTILRSRSKPSPTERR